MTESTAATAAVSSEIRTDKEKMLAGLPYQAQDPGLREERLQAKRLLRTYNASAPDAAVERKALLKQLLGSSGEQIEVEPPFQCDYGYNLHVGENFYANYGCVVLDCAPVHIGANVFLGPGVHIYTAEHPLESGLRNQGIETARPVSIGDDVWIGGGVIIQAGVSIGAGSTIAAGSVVTRDIPSGVLAMGVPARVVREIKP
jgi:maltose O-acetyltransferase